VYVDGSLGETFTNRVVGPTVSNTHTTYVSTGKYWELNGTLTSNISVEANTFLSGDAPHSVSMWFNSSNLEANVSNSCIFSLATEEKLDSVNLDLQSNTWHNLTYAYQGEGGSRVTYLDGRKVAEDQAEYTFGDYPPFAMTGYSQGGYVVSASQESSSYEVWRVFDDTSGLWLTGTGEYPSGVYDSSVTGLYNLGTLTGGGSTDNGHYLKLELPHKLKISYVNMHARTGYETQAPKNFKFYGSNDDTNWEQIGPSFSNEAPQDDGTSYYTLNSIKAYKFIGLVVTETVGDGNGRLAIEELKFYGHRENDLVRLPDPTNVLKYPHIVMTGPAQRGYVASASSYFGLLNQYAGWNAFNETVDDPDGWVSATLSYQSSGTTRLPISHSTGAGGIDNLSGIDATSSGGDTARNGSWLKIELPHKLKLSQMKLFRRQSVQRIVQGFVYGSNDNITFYQISNNLSGISNIGTYSNTDPLIIIPTDTTTAYKYFVVQVTASSSDIANIGNLEFYGTGVDSIPIQIGGGNIDKVANFRVYDKFIGEDQALEIWDAQKDTFRGVKNSMTLQKGRLGIGTTEPEGRLAVLDEPHNLEEFPPRAMTAGETYMEGHGVFCASATEIYPNAYAYKAFNKIQSGSGLDFHWSANAADYDNVTGVYTGSSDYFTNVEGQIALGHWIQIEFPYKINYRYSEIQGPDHAAGRQPHTGYIVGSNDLSGVWTSLHNYSGMTRTGVRDFVTYTPPTISTQSFKYFRLVIEKMGGGNTTAGVSQWHIFGTREQGQSVLHDGQLTLTKNLTVPSIGPSVTNTRHVVPKRHKLVLEFDTSTNPTGLTTVKDTSEMGNDGTLRGTAYYSIGDKAFKFDGRGATYIYKSGASGIPSGDAIYSVVGWVNVEPSISVTSALLTFGSAWGLATIGAVSINTSYGFQASIGGDSVLSPNGVITPNTWHHIAAVKVATGVCTVNTYDLYLDGVLITSKTYSGSNRTQNIGTGTKYLGVGGGFTGVVTDAFDGLISNPKLYNTALTAGDVKTLYDMGRGDSYHVTNFQNTLVGINLGNGQAPRSALDVMGDVSIEGLVQRAGGARGLQIKTNNSVGSLISYDHSEPLNGNFLYQDIITITVYAPSGINYHWQRRMQISRVGSLVSLTGYVVYRANASTQTPYIILPWNQIGCNQRQRPTLVASFGTGGWVPIGDADGLRLYGPYTVANGVQYNDIKLLVDVGMVGAYA
jgi:hypothetical protein